MNEFLIVLSEYLFRLTGGIPIIESFWAVAFFGTIFLIYILSAYIVQL